MHFSALPFWQMTMVTGVILAGGGAKRMGRAKQLLPLGEKPAIWWVAKEASRSRLAEVLVITGAFGEAVGQTVADLPLRVVHNEQWAWGQSTSVIKAVQAANCRARGILFLLADQPLVNAEIINKMIAAFMEDTTKICVPSCKGRAGNPVLFPLRGGWREKLLELAGDEGARRLIRANREVVTYVELTAEQVFADMDTPQDYEAMCLLWQKRKRY
jgi:molybdenum cofactor cytidylyltransferase